MDKDFCIHDGILEGVTFEELIITLQCNESEINEATVKKVLSDIIESKIEDAKFLVQKHMEKIIEQSE